MRQTKEQSDTIILKTDGRCTDNTCNICFYDMLSGCGFFGLRGLQYNDSKIDLILKERYKDVVRVLQ